MNGPADEAPRPVGTRVTWLGAVLNLVLAVVKGFAGIVGGSSAMLADAVHSLSDLASDGVTLVSLRAAAKPADDDHPYGHGRFETLGTITVSVILLGAAVGIARDAWGRLADPTEPGVIAVWAALDSRIVVLGWRSQLLAFVLFQTHFVARIGLRLGLLASQLELYRARP